MRPILAFEYFKLRKWMTTWILALILVGLIVLLYSVLWSISGQERTFGSHNQFTSEDLRRALFLQSAVPFSLSIVGSFGIILSVVLAAGAVGSEYSWGTVRLVATAAPDVFEWKVASRKPLTEVLGGSGVSAAAQQAVTLLEPGKAVEREISGKEAHKYRIALKPGEYAGVVVEQRGIDVVVYIVDASGKVIRTERFVGRQGLNGINWDLRHNGPTLVALKTTPPENPHIWEEPRFQGTDTRRITHWGITPQTGIPLAAPGKYEARFTVDGQQYSKAFEVLNDPAVAASVDDLQTSTAMQVRIRDDITQTSEMVNRMEVWRKQIEDQITANAGKADVTKALTDLNKTIVDTELKLVSRSEMLSDDKYFPEAYKVYMNLIWLSGGVGQGASDEAGSIDYKPTETQAQVLQAIEKDLASAKAGFEKLQSTDLPAFNKAMAGKVPPIGDKPVATSPPGL